MIASYSPRLASALHLANRLAVLASVLGSGGGCTVILKPNDEVERCDNPDDCSPTGDGRYVPICTVDMENDEFDTTQIESICMAEFKSIPCEPTRAGTRNGLREKSGESMCTDLGCSDGNRGKVGCRPPQGTPDCAEGLTLDGDGFCVDPNADQPVIPAVFLDDNDLEPDQHIRDQYCKSYFCDDTFVCSAQGRCQPCDPDKDYGAGGCGLVYSEGAPAKIYVLGSALQDQCAGADVNEDQPAVFGECS